MGVYIKDLHKAKHCINCPLMMSNADGDWCALQDEETNESFKSWDDMRKHCPLVEVKEPHGRLIDADEFMRLLECYAITAKDFEFCDNSRFALEKADTIIEAEVNDED